MLDKIIATSALVSNLLLGSAASESVAQQAAVLAEPTPMAKVTLDLDSRYAASSVSEGFKENILITLNYFGKDNPKGLILYPGNVFAFHKEILPVFAESKIITQESNFGPKYGYKSVAGLYGNGVCHLASLMNKGARIAGLEVTSPANHNYASIPGIEKEYGVSISTRNAPQTQNLYIRNNFDYPVELKFNLDGSNLIFRVLPVI